jgi:hypothetical protein
MVLGEALSRSTFGAHVLPPMPVPEVLFVPVNFVKLMVGLAAVFVTACALLKT